MLGERLIRTGRPKKGYRAWVLSYPDIRFDGFIANDDAVFFGIPLPLYDNLRGMYDVYDKKTKEQADDEGKIRILGKPVERVENVRVYEKIRKRAESRPYERKIKTENTVWILPYSLLSSHSRTLAIFRLAIPAIYSIPVMQSAITAKSAIRFQTGSRIRENSSKRAIRYNRQSPQPYKGRYGPVQKPGLIHLRSGLAEKKPPEQKLYDPSRHRADKE